MMRFSADMVQLLTYSIYGAAWALWGLGMFLLGWALGRNNGLARAPEETKRALLDQQQKRLVAEGLLDAERRVSRRLEATLNALTAPGEPTVEPRIRAVR